MCYFKKKFVFCVFNIVCGYCTVIFPNMYCFWFLLIDVALSTAQFRHHATEQIVDYFLYTRSIEITEVFTAPFRHRSDYIWIYHKSFLISQRTKKKGKHIIVFCFKSLYNFFLCIYMYVPFHRPVVVLQIAFLRISAIFRNCFIFLSAVRVYL